MSRIDMAYLRQWIGRETRAHDVLAVRHAHLLAATLNLSPTSLQEGASLPPLWHWIYFLEARPHQELGRDGHPARGGFLPLVPLENRMWAGGTVVFNTDLPLGAEVQKRSRIQSVEHKQGRSGELVFVTVLHEVLYQGQVAVWETHDIVYKDASPPGTVSASVPMPVPMHSKVYVPTSTTLFRYSALTFNGHRIHYDVDYCREVEGYANLVVHGPLNATVLACYAHEITGKRLKQFRYRGLQPSLVGQTLSINAKPDGSDWNLWIGLPDGSASMQAHAFF